MKKSPAVIVGGLTVWYISSSIIEVSILLLFCNITKDEYSKCSYKFNCLAEILRSNIIKLIGAHGKFAEENH